MRGVFMALCVTALLAGCSIESPPETAPVAVEEDVAPVTSDVAPKWDIGGIETHTYIEARLDTSSLPASVTFDELVNRRYRVNLVSVNVSEPLPERLPVNIALVVDEDLSQAPFLARYTVYRGDEVLGEGSLVAGERGITTLEGSPYDVLAGLETVPRDMLVSVKADLFMLPPGTDPQSVDPSTYDTSPLERGTTQSNPVRVNFSGEKDDLPNAFPIEPVTDPLGQTE